MNGGAETGGMLRGAWLADAAADLGCKMMTGVPVMAQLWPEAHGALKAHGGGSCGSGEAASPTSKCFYRIGVGVGSGTRMPVSLTSFAWKLGSPKLSGFRVLRQSD